MEFVKGGPTKPEIATISLSKLQLTKNDVFADIGCGTGCISIMASRVAAEVYAIDSREEAINATRRNVESADINNITIINGEAPLALDVLPVLDCAFIGGTRNIISVLGVLEKKVQGRIVVNAVRLQTVATIIKTMQDRGFFEEAVHVQVAKSYPLADDIAFKPINPVYIIVGDTQKEVP
ncbi:MAG: precorrin-6Y C5,15-methyltransferase (decarboxylating) subunit CbiT [Methanosarcinales archaeon]|nr:precorrin-6Y C5,15-methyltransferase (decarboxylating) subunit CbiT [ANME-2 cluster archaeon]MDW7776363.1 precorrin-6Y C5,15-methyltransferase (decarboxylating) subunit CbiT [Methanosarcinales archaeon]